MRSSTYRNNYSLNFFFHSYTFGLTVTLRNMSSAASCEYTIVQGEIPSIEILQQITPTSIRAVAKVGGPPDTTLTWSFSEDTEYESMDNTQGLDLESPPIGDAPTGKFKLYISSPKRPTTTANGGKWSDTLAFTSNLKAGGQYKITATANSGSAGAQAERSFIAQMPSGPSNGSIKVSGTLLT